MTRLCEVGKANIVWTKLKEKMRQKALVGVSGTVAEVVGEDGYVFGCVWVVVQSGSRL